MLRADDTYDPPSVGMDSTGVTLGALAAHGSADGATVAGTGVSAMASGVAALRALAARRPHAMFDDPFAAPLVEALGVECFTRIASGTTPDDAAAGTWGVVADGMAVRTQFYDEFLVHAMLAGVRQVVILASGLDARAYRLPWHPGTVLFEVDRPDVLAFKARELHELGASSRAHVRSVAADLPGDWPDALWCNDFDLSAPTAWVAEGLLAQITPTAVDLLLDRIAAMSAPGSRLALDWHPDLAVADPADVYYPHGRRDVDAYLAVRGWTTSTTTAAERAAASGIDVRPDAALAGLFGARLTSAVLG